MNIVFDLGGVVFNWLPDQLVKDAIPNSKLRTLVREKVIAHQDWLELDRGSLTLETAVANAAQRTGISENDLEDFFAKVAPSLTPIKESIDLIHELHGLAKHELFVLSNMHHASINYLESNFDIWNLFRARVISCRIGMIKPEPEIFRYLLESNKLRARDTLFIDDMPDNTEAAAAAGLSTIQFRSASDCRRQLQEMKCI